MTQQITKYICPNCKSTLFNDYICRNCDSALNPDMVKYYNDAYNDGQRANIDNVYQTSDAHQEKVNDLLHSIFGFGYWKTKYKIDWCETCNVAIIKCPHCQNTSCNAGSCDYCFSDFDEFKNAKCQVEDYLDEHERRVYDKAQTIKRHILISLSKGELKIDWKKQKEQGHTSQHDDELLNL